uniref:Large ribosomal subunit protein uL6 alpha-beta domain-containing protein n=1 Tax=Alexandrium andersonii TaxID=327968 RepID=A0A7S2IVU3_9DINO|mmetsp:Transcript_89811/g.201009  ORF Transcript_89811/g.201009 Transcript_89811/m.201009 type:complete len:189 (+) Transcript_89811:96-662(+)
MKTLVQEESIKVPKGIEIKIKAKTVEVKGKHGTLKRDFKHMPIELWIGNAGKEVKARMYFAKTKQLSMLRSVCSHIQNLFDGVQNRFEYRMRLVYAHFPINANITNGGTTIELRNFLGEKIVRTVNMLPGVKVEKSAQTKDELVVTGADIENTSQSAALIRQSCLVKNKDIRKFLDGVYVSSHGVIED